MKNDQLLSDTNVIQTYSASDMVPASDMKLEKHSKKP